MAAARWPALCALQEESCTGVPAPDRGDCWVPHSSLTAWELSDLRPGVQQVGLGPGSHSDQA